MDPSSVDELWADLATPPAPPEADLVRIGLACLDAREYQLAKKVADRLMDVGAGRRWCWL